MVDTELFPENSPAGAERLHTGTSPAEPVWVAGYHNERRNIKTYGYKVNQCQPPQKTTFTGFQPEPKSLCRTTCRV
jgi:hypothetical protein